MFKQAAKVEIADVPYKGAGPALQDAIAGHVPLSMASLAGATPQIAAAVPFLEKHAESTGKVGAVGFCWGGGMVNRIAILSPDLDAAVA
jgi:dienelactone hydrolase